MILGTEPKAACMLGKPSASWVIPSPFHLHPFLIVGTVSISSFVVIVDDDDDDFWF